MESSSEEQNTDQTSTLRKASSVRKRTRPSRQRATRESLKNKTNEIQKTVVKSPKPDARILDSKDVRKAPTPFAAGKVAKRKKQKIWAVVIVLLIVGVSASAGVGFTDSGQIDVKKTIEERNDRIRNNKASDKDLSASQIEVPVQNTNSVQKPDGGLKGRGIGTVTPKPVPVAEPASTTATSTDATASSTATGTSTTEEEKSEDVEVEGVEEVSENVE